MNRHLSIHRPHFPSLRGGRGVSVSHGRLEVGAAGAIALGAFAVGAIAIGALAINRLVIRRARIDRLSVGTLEVDRLVVRHREREAEVAAGK